MDGVKEEGERKTLRPEKLGWKIVGRKMPKSKQSEMEF